MIESGMFGGGNGVDVTCSEPKLKITVVSSSNGSSLSVKSDVNVRLLTTLLLMKLIDLFLKLLILFTV